MVDLVVTLPVSRLIYAAEFLGAPNVDSCPPHDDPQTPCWNTRHFDPYTQGDPIDIECTECWLRYFINGD